MQSEYEARVTKALETAAPLDDVKNEAWTQIASLERMQGFIGEWEGGKPPPKESRKKLPYKLQFEDPLDAASWLLRDELQVLDGKERGTMPKQHRDTLDRLPPDADDEHPEAPI